MSSSTQLDFPSSPQSLVSLCLQKTLLENLPVDDLPLTLQQDLGLFGGGQFVKKEQQITIEGQPSTVFGIENDSQLDVKKSGDGYQLFGNRGVNDLTVGDFVKNDQFGKFRKKDWLEVEARSVYKYVWQFEDGDGLHREKGGWRIVFSERGMSLTREGEVLMNNRRISFRKVEAEFEKRV
jgi:hypothetical protein